MSIRFKFLLVLKLLTRRHICCRLYPYYKERRDTMANQSEPKGSTGIAAIVAIIIVLIISLSTCSGGSSSSGRSWSDLSETEKANARWAYEAQQAINDRR